MIKVTNSHFELYKETLQEAFDMLSTWEFEGPVTFEYVEKSGNDLDKVARADRTIGPIQGYQVKRNKQVDVPTEQWQKDMERKLARAEETLVILCAYLTSTNTIDMNDWNKYLQLSRGY